MGLTACGGDDATAATPNSRNTPAKALRVAVIPMGTTHEFWKSVPAGAIKAQRELVATGTPIEAIWKGPLKEDDRTSHTDTVQTLFLCQGVDGIVLAPLDSKALIAPVTLAVGSKIPVVIIDSGLESESPASTVVTNNSTGGAFAGTLLGELLPGKGNVLMLRYQEGSMSTGERETGLLEAMRACPGITLISTDQYPLVTRETALTARQNMLNRFKDQLPASGDGRHRDWGFVWQHNWIGDRPGPSAAICRNAWHAGPSPRRNQGLGRQLSRQLPERRLA